MKIAVVENVHTFTEKKNITNSSSSSSSGDCLMMLTKCFYTPQPSTPDHRLAKSIFHFDDMDMICMEVSRTNVDPLEIYNAFSYCLPVSLLEHSVKILWTTTTIFVFMVENDWFRFVDNVIPCLISTEKITTQMNYPLVPFIVHSLLNPNISDSLRILAGESVLHLFISFNWKKKFPINLTNIRRMIKLLEICDIETDLIQAYKDWYNCFVEVEDGEIVLNEKNPLIEKRPKLRIDKPSFYSALLCISLWPHFGICITKESLFVLSKIRTDLPSNTNINAVFDFLYTTNNPNDQYPIKLPSLIHDNIDPLDVLWDMAFHPRTSISDRKTILFGLLPISNYGNDNPPFYFTKKRSLVSANDPMLINQEKSHITKTKSDVMVSDSEIKVADVLQAMEMLKTLKPIGRCKPSTTLFTSYRLSGVEILKNKKKPPTFPVEKNIVNSRAMIYSPLPEFTTTHTLQTIMKKRNKIDITLGSHPDFLSCVLIHPITTIRNFPPVCSLLIDNRIWDKSWFSKQNDFLGIEKKLLKKAKASDNRKKGFYSTFFLF